MPKIKAKAISVAGNKILERIRHNTPPEIAEQIREEANHRALVDVFGEGFEVDAQGKPIEQGRYSTKWLLAHTDEECEIHFSAIGRWVGPQAERAERERIAKLRAGKK